MRILLLSAYDAVSHRSWHQGLLNTFSECEWTIFTMPPRYFSWRIRGNALHFSEKIRQEVNLENIDLVIVTSMVDLASLRGICPELCTVPTLIYFHENQFTYPISGKSHPSIEPAMVNLYSALAADLLVFNSEFNKESFRCGCSALLKRFPDYVPLQLTDSIMNKSCVVPVGLDDTLFTMKASEQAKKNSTHIVWNHRWEYDKGPDRLFAMIKTLPEFGKYTFHILGQAFNNVPEVFTDIKYILEERSWLGRWGPLESRAEYLSLLSDSDFVLSSAVHDFQGLAVQEAVVLGCTPLVPDRLAYPLIFPLVNRYTSFMAGEAEDLEREARAACELLQQFIENPPAPVCLKHYRWSELEARYAQVFEDTRSRFNA